ncbi:MAG: GNAT family N-acetyltransferase [Paracoccaceae bacterium]
MGRWRPFPARACGGGGANGGVARCGARCATSARGGRPIWRGAADLRKSLRGTAQAVREAGGVLRIARQPGPEAEAILGAALDLSARSWKGRSGTDIGTQASDRRFISAIWRRFSARGAMWIAILEIEGLCAASFFLLHDGARGYGLISDFDEAFAALSPGRHILAEVLRAAAEAGLDSVDLLRATPMTERFADATPSFSRLRLYRRAGVFALWLGGERLLAPLGRNLRKARRQRRRKRVAFTDRDSRETGWKQ